MLIQVRYKTGKPFMKLVRVGETDSKRTWIFTFCDPVHKLMQSVIISKELPWQAMEESWGRLYMKWSEYLTKR